MKKLINDVADVVPESLAGFGKAHPDIIRTDLTQMLVTRAGGPVSGKVALVSGGGSGHEPLHGGFVGLGMLDAAAAGHVFTSPVPVDQLVVVYLVGSTVGGLVGAFLYEFIGRERPEAAAA